MKLGRRDAVPHENSFGIEFHIGRLLLVHTDKIVDPVERDGFALRFGAQHSVGLARDANERHALKVRPVFSGGLRPH